MMDNKLIGTFKSSNQEDTISYYIYKPEQEPRAILQLSHGMCEYVERYEGFAEFLNSNGILFCGNDHLGHGNSAVDDEHLGYFAEDNGYKYLAEDVNRLTQIMKKQYPHTPYFLLGHSMGSFIARDYITKYSGNLDGALIVGTNGGNKFSKLAILISSIVICFWGEFYRSNFISNLAFGAYNKRFAPINSTHDWLSRDGAIVSHYLDDSKCNFVFTASGFHDLFKLLDSVSSPDWAGKVPKDLPIIIMSGQDDPVGDYGKGVLNVYNKLTLAGVADLSFKLYENCRHEILNETNKQEVFADVLNWINDRIKQNCIL